MTVIGVREASATATAVFPTPVGPTMTGVRSLASGAAKTAFQLVLWKLHHRRSAVHVVRGEGRGEQPHDELTHLVPIERLPSFDRGAARVGRGESLEAVLPAAEPAAREIGDELLQAARGLEPRMRIRGRVDDDAPARERLDL